MKNFDEYDRENPEVWEKFQEIAFKAIEKGFNHYSSKGIFELIRWHTKTSGNDGFKVNNIYTAYYARKFNNKFPEHNNFFRLRKVKDNGSS